MAGYRTASILLLLICFSLGLARAGQEKEQDWQPEPPPAMPEKWDWVKLVSDEWLKGELIVMYDKELEFDSDEMDLQTLDFADIKEIRTAQIVQIRFTSNVEAVGRLYLSGDKVRVLGEKDQTFDRNTVVSITAGSPKEINYWNFKVTLGANIRSGNTDQTELNTSAKIQRRTVASRIVLDFRSNYNVTDGILAADNERGNGVWDKFVTQRLFVRPAFGEYFRDPFQNVSERVTFGVGAGYELIDTKKTDWRVSGGPAYQRTRFDDVLPGTPEEESTPALVLAMLFDTELTGWLDFTQEFQFQLTDKASGQYNFHWVTTFETEITRLLDFDVSFVWDRIQKPRENSDGTVPEQDDYRLIVGLTFEW